MAIQGVPEEVRRVKGDNTSEFMRPMPGAARMYPETDVPPVKLTRELIDAAPVPELPQKRIRRYTRDLKLSMQQARQLISEGLEWNFEYIVSLLQGSARENARLIASVLLNILPELRRDGVEVGRLEPEDIVDVITEFRNGTYSRDAIADVLREMVNTGKSAKETAYSLGIVSVSQEDVEEVIRRVVNERVEFVRKRGKGAAGPLMGVVMKELRGKADGKTVNMLLTRAIEMLMEEKK